MERGFDASTLLPETRPLRLDRVRRALASRSGPVPGGGLGPSDVVRNSCSTTRSVRSQRVVEKLNSCSTTRSVRVERRRATSEYHCPGTRPA